MFFGHLKDFKILKFPFRNKGKETEEILEDHHKIFCCCVYLHNFYLFPNGIRKY